FFWIKLPHYGFAARTNSNRPRKLSQVIFLAKEINLSKNTILNIVIFLMMYIICISFFVSE
ncbi:MAG: hypothetical protein ACXVED_15370, partial [Bacteroidia bacterium]